MMFVSGIITVVLLTEVDRLTKDAQHALRRTMERYMFTCRLILCCNSTSKVIGPIRSRCLAVRVPLPSVEEVSLLKCKPFFMGDVHYKDMSRLTLKYLVIMSESHE